MDEVAIGLANSIRKVDPAPVLTIQSMYSFASGSYVDLGTEAGVSPGNGTYHGARDNIPSGDFYLLFTQYSAGVPVTVKSSTSLEHDASHATVRLSNGDIMWFAGRALSPGPTSRVHRYVISTNSLAFKAAYAGGAKEGVSAAVLTSGKVLVGGGYASATTYADFYEYDPATDLYVAKASRPVAAQQLMMLGLQDGKVFTIGGSPGSPTYTNTNTPYVWDPTTNTWTAKAVRPGDTAGVTRKFVYKASAGVIVMFGRSGTTPYVNSIGTSIAASYIIDWYDIASNSWSTLDTAPTSSQMSSMSNSDQTILCPWATDTSILPKDVDYNIYEGLISIGDRSLYPGVGNLIAYLASK